MPAQIEIENYQSLKKVSLEVKGLTSVTGTNNSGKSALMRAIRSVFQNTPGTHFIRHGTEETTVSVSLNGKKVTWSKTRKGKPKYQFPNTEPIFPGLELPTPLQDLGVCSLEIGNEHIWPNFAPQFTGQVFLLDRPGSALAEAVADVERVHKLNGALKLSESARRDADSKLKESRNAKAEVDETLSRFAGLDTVFDGLRQVKSLRDSVAACQQQEQTILTLQTRLIRSEGAVKALAGCDQLEVPSLESLTAHLANLTETVALRTKWVHSAGTLSKLEGIGSLQVCSLANVKEAAEGLVLVQTMVKAIQSIRCVPPPSVAVPSVPELPDILSFLYKTKQTRDRLLGDISSTNTSISELKVELDAVSVALQDALLAVGECPTCGEKHDQTTLAH